MMRSCWSLVELEVRELLTEYEFPGDDAPVVRVSALKALEGDAEWQAKVLELMAAVDAFVPEPEREMDKPFLMPIEDVFTITGRGTVVTGKVEQGMVHTGDEVEIVGLRADAEDDVYGGGDVPQVAGSGSGGGQHRGVVAGDEEGGGGAGSGVVQAGVDHAAHRFRGSGVCVDQGGGWPAQAVLQQLPAAVLFPDDGCDGHDHVAGGDRDVMPGDNTAMTVELVKPIAMDEGLRFAIREGGRTVGAGRVTKIIK